MAGEGFIALVLEGDSFVFCESSHREWEMKAVAAAMHPSFVSERWRGKEGTVS